jgi:hypothetical protein
LEYEEVLLRNGAVNTFQQPTDTDTITEDEVFSMLSKSRLIMRAANQWKFVPCGGRFEYLHRSPASTGRKETGAQCLGV